MKKVYFAPEVETIMLETAGFLAASIPGSDGENSGTSNPSEEELDDLLG